jgi:hypothetical protein
LLFTAFYDILEVYKILLKKYKREQAMINVTEQVPDNTFAVFIDDHSCDEDAVRRVLRKLDHKRDWFTPHFYKCLPLSIANTYGYCIVSEFDFGVVWDGGDLPENLKILLPDDITDNAIGLYPKISSHFGSGILTIEPPFHIRTAPGINIMTINPPNCILPNITVMSGVVETDNLSRSFTFNLKVQTPNIEVIIPKGTPLASFIPIPRYFADSFDIKFADEIFSSDVVIEELQTTDDTLFKRHEIEYNLVPPVGLDYFRGQDVYGNKFKDHQLPKRSK